MPEKRGFALASQEYLPYLKYTLTVTWLAIYSFLAKRVQYSSSDCLLTLTLFQQCTPTPYLLRKELFCLSLLSLI